jgi:radical SAM superfamily enzyme YgiQ (UPF0313 family)
MRAVLISTYELGRQPFGLASPAAWLRAAGVEVTSVDLAVADLPEAAVRAADLVAFYLPMHTATRLAAAQIPRVRALNPRAHLCAYGLYAPLNADLLHGLGVATLIGGEFEGALAELCRSLDGPAAGAAPGEPQIVLDRLAFIPPDRSDLPPLSAYAGLSMPGGERLAVGYTEASRGCKHTCRHCPVVPVYNGRFRAVPREVVLEDIRRQVAAGAQHITFGDPDFLNGPGHAMPLVRALHAEFPGLSYDATIKVEHLLKHADLLPELRETGCVLVTSAVESADDCVLRLLDKGHTRADFIRAARLMRAAGLPLSPTFVTFTPWTTRAAYCDLLALIAELGLVEHVAPVQYAIRLLFPAGSRLLELEEARALVGPFDRDALCYPWRHPDPAMDELYEQVRRVAQQRSLSRPEAFAEVWRLAHAAPLPASQFDLVSRPIPQLTEPWYC